MGQREGIMVSKDEISIQEYHGSRNAMHIKQDIIKAIKEVIDENRNDL